MLQTIKSMGLHPCPRCLIVKGDIPEVGSFLDMKKRQEARVYSIEDVESARRAIFNSGRSISYNGPYNSLKAGSWVPTRVCLFLTLTPHPIDGILVERVCDRTRSQPISVDGRRCHA